MNEYYFRSDTVCYEKGLLDGLRDDERETGPPGRIRFAVSVPLMAPSKAAIVELDESAWQPYR